MYYIYNLCLYVYTNIYICIQSFIILYVKWWTLNSWISSPWVSLVAQLVNNLPAIQETWFDSWVGKIPWRRNRLHIPVFCGFPGGSFGNESACSVRDLGSSPGLGSPLEGGHGNPLQNSCLENHYGQRSLADCSSWGHSIRHDLSN